MAVRREQLDGLVCTHEDHDPQTCDNGVRYLHSRCHGDVPTWARYENGVVSILCAECDALVVAIEVAGAPPPRVRGRRPA